MIEFLRLHPDQANAIAALCAVFVSLISIVLTCFSLFQQRRHDLKSVTPIASVPIADYEDRLAVKLRNNGIGPLIVSRFIVTNGETQQDDIISWMPEPPPGILWTTFYDSVDGLALLPGKEAVIIELNGDDNDRKFAKFRDQVRRSLSDLVIRVEYRDIYDRTMPEKSTDLKFFGRHFDKA